jgi:hypothetical protein
MNFDEAIVEFQRRVKEKGMGPLTGTYVFDLETEGKWHLRPVQSCGLNCDDAEASYEFVRVEPPACTFKASPEAFLSIVANPASVMSLLMQKKLVIDNMPEAVQFAKQAMKLL